MQEEDKRFGEKVAEKVKQNILDQIEHKHDWDEESLKHWRAWGSWFSWGSPVGLGLFLVSIGVLLVLLHYAAIIK